MSEAGQDMIKKEVLDLVSRHVNNAVELDEAIDILDGLKQLVNNLGARQGQQRRYLTYSEAL
jgi:hypothetical protein